MKNKIGLKVSQNLGINAHGAETHTVVAFIKSFSKEYDVDLIGCEVFPEELKKYNRFTYIRYASVSRIIRKVLHVPISMINTLLYTYREKPDLLFMAGGVFYNGLAILIAGKIFGVKTVVRTAEDHFNYYKFCENLNCRFKHFFITNLFSKFVLKHSDYVLTVGEASKKYFISKGINEKKIFGIPGPISHVDFSNVKEKSILRKELGLPRDKTIVLYAGAISGVKGTDELPQIIEKVLREDKSFFFCIIGDETNGSRITNEIAESVGRHGVLIPPQSQEELKRYFGASDVLLFLTKVGVGYGQIAIEASLAKLPVIGFNPGLDVEWFLKENCYRDIDGIINKILNKSYGCTKIPSEFNSAYIETKHMEMLKKVFGEIH